MGQMTYALMLGCPVPESEWTDMSWTPGADDEDGDHIPWVFDGFKPGKGPEIAYDEEYATMGFFLAVGASGKRGIPSLDGPIDVTAVEQHPLFRAAHKAAIKQWTRYAEYAWKHHAEELPKEPRLYLVEVEVA